MKIKLKYTFEASISTYLLILLIVTIMNLMQHAPITAGYSMYTIAFAIAVPIVFILIIVDELHTQALLKKNENH